MSQLKTNKYKNKICENSMTFEDCEMAILRMAVDENENELNKIFAILEEFIENKKLILYGGYAINAILPKYARFYNEDTDLPDYDFYSPNSLEHAIELANVYFKKGYTEVEAKAGVHYGTFKVYVNFIPIADITFLEKEIFNNIQKESIKMNGMMYAPANFLRMNMFLELSRPMGDVSRWEKVLKRLNMLNEFYPLVINENCNTVDFQRQMDTNTKDSEKIYLIVRDTFIFLGAVFFGGYASSLYSQYMPINQRKIIDKIPDFDVLYENPENAANIVKEKLLENGFSNVNIIKHEQIGEIIPMHYEIRINKEIIAFIYEPIACHSYNKIHIQKKIINVATIDTMLSFYFAFYYSNKPYYYRDRILCMIHFLFHVEEQNRLAQKGLLKRFTVSCVGKQPTLENIRFEKTKKFKELQHDKFSKKYMMWFLKYNPSVFFIKNPFNIAHSTSTNIQNMQSTIKKQKNMKSSIKYNLMKRKTHKKKRNSHIFKPEMSPYRLWKK
jgi:hypothetical protein